MKRIYTPRTHKKILIVDDDQAVASIYQNKLQRERFEVDIANTGESALVKLEIAPVDLVILDLSLPGMDGLEILKTIRLQSGAHALPVIVFSNSYVPGLMQAALEAGATKCVNKSDCTPRQIAEVVREVLNVTAIADRTLSEEFEEGDQARLVTDFRAGAPRRFGELRAGHHAFVAAQKGDLRLAELYEMHRQARRLAGAAGVGGFRKIAQLAGALEALLFQLYTRPAIITPSTTRTIAQAIDRLAELFDHAKSPSEPEVSASPAILVVDDEIISREAIGAALKKANLAAVCLEDSIAAEVLLKETHFDLIFLDVEMPGQSGLDLCASIQKMATNSATPVVFVTCHSDFESRALTSLSGGKDFISKPFLPVELAVKALTWLFKEKAQLFSTATGHGNNINEQSTARAFGSNNSLMKTNQNDLVQSSRQRTNEPVSASVQCEPGWIPFKPPWEGSAHSPSGVIAARFDKTTTIVIADDDPVSRELVFSTVSQWGFHTVVTQDGHEAMAAIRAEKGPVVAILDWMMPGMDGLEVCRRVRQIGKPVHIILLTVRAAKENLVEALESGADDYLVKPFDKNELHARIHVGMRILNLQNALSEHVADLEKALSEVEELRSKISMSL